MIWIGRRHLGIVAYFRALVRTGAGRQTGGDHGGQGDAGLGRIPAARSSAAAAVAQLGGVDLTGLAVDHFHDDQAFRDRRSSHQVRESGVGERRQLQRPTVPVQIQAGKGCSQAGVDGRHIEGVGSRDLHGQQSFAGVVPQEIVVGVLVHRVHRALRA
ncbi:hypothetical protein [Rhodovibrio sodomensis]|uniref:hypothetical protein n=1 Tax=Rhodovibrio sodomensis TaxID=1088 RepID=UPI001903F715|nr:hypothetical protein [Rhodovibrio sodomensis]